MITNIEKLKKLQAKEMLQRYTDGEPVKEIARFYGIANPQNIHYYIRKYCGPISAQQKMKRLKSLIKKGSPE